jgi:cysteinyl-tRNA synthetase
MLRVYNTLTKTKEPFDPVRPGKVGIYLCGPTVYKPSHIGHMVGPVIFDTIKRYLAYNGYDVTLVVNITDVDDKLIAESQRRGMAMPELAAEMTADYMQNIAALGIDTIDAFPRCTDNIGEIVAFIQALIKRGFAYASDGDVYFDVTKDGEYGKLSHRSVDALQGEGGDMAQRKRSTADFALWKSAKPGEPAWDSPWGPGRPGWHIECSAMSRRLLGETFDIHGGGLDLVFPHHENEIAQSECCHGKPMARYWLHNGLMQASDEVGKVGGRNTRPGEGDLDAQQVGKISKSKGSAPFRDLLRQFAAETIRFFILSTQYRRPIDYGEARLQEVQTALDAFYRFVKRFQRVTGESYYQLAAPARRVEGELKPGDDALLGAAAEHRARFLEAMDDDFNTGGAIGVLFEFLRSLNKFCDDEKLEEPGSRSAEKLSSLKKATATFREVTLTLGLFRAPPAATEGGDDSLVGQLMELLIQMRAEARKKKDFATADLIRNRLTEIGVVLEDRPGGTEWSRKA